MWRHINTIPFSIFSLTNLLAAGLVFSVQPMISKLLLPAYGGSSMVWLAALMFFQGGLLLAYGYAHLLSSRFSTRQLIFIHLTVLILSLLFLPVTVHETTFANWYPSLSVALILAISIGLPYLVVCTTSPLTQRWYADLYPESPPPYLLYSVSNAGSLMALLAYPMLIEPHLPMHEQQLLWTALYIVLIINIAILAWRLPSRDRSTAKHIKSTTTWPSRLRWMLYAFVPALYLMGVTLHISIDIAATPFLWVIPLSLYLISFILVFARPALAHAGWVSGAQVCVIILLAFYFNIADSSFLLLLHLAGLFLTGVIAHGYLARSRPEDKAQITDFYIWIALGGFLGGVSSAIVAPLLFNSVLEYPLAIIAACLIRPTYSQSTLRNDLMWLAAFVAALAILTRIELPSPLQAYIVFGFITVTLYLFRLRPLRLGVSVALLLLSESLFGISDTLYAKRSFYGIYQTYLSVNQQVKYLMSGTTIHGAQATDPRLQILPLGYYNVEGPLGDIMVRQATAGRLRHIGGIGLGAGTIACYVRPESEIVFFEIDPAMVEIATKEFSYLQRCAPDAKIHISDGRLGMAAMPDAYFDVLVVDAFSSDAIPIHLLTTEAMRSYLDKISEEGVVMFHVSNRYVDLKPVVAAVAQTVGAYAYSRDYEPSQRELERGALASEWLAVVKHTRLDTLPGWTAAHGNTPWTDDYTNLFSAVEWKKVLLR